MYIELSSADNRKIALAIAEADIDETEITVTIDDIDFDVMFIKEVVDYEEEETNSKYSIYTKVSVLVIEVSGSSGIPVGVNYQEIEKYSEEILLK